jgi:hypothetical protein
VHACTNGSSAVTTPQTESFCCSPAPQVMHAIGIAGTRLSFDREKSQLSHSAYLELAEACMSNDPNDRPPFHTMHIVSRFAMAPPAHVSVR